jgi:hypothetical protein
MKRSFECKVSKASKDAREPRKNIKKSPSIEPKMLFNIFLLLFSSFSVVIQAPGE